mmetsp:Transcript_22646/g.57357  ORF Transcript_22646/g.57357 Transcript_22646/m.57357 type:complete len:348 (-) Transcript_22646:273-1316(-)
MDCQRHCRRCVRVFRRPEYQRVSRAAESPRQHVSASVSARPAHSRRRTRYAQCDFRRQLARRHPAHVRERFWRRHQAQALHGHRPVPLVRRLHQRFQQGHLARLLHAADLQLVALPEAGVVYILQAQLEPRVAEMRRAKVAKVRLQALRWLRGRAELVVRARTGLVPVVVGVPHDHTRVQVLQGHFHSVHAAREQERGVLVPVRVETLAIVQLRCIAAAHAGGVLVHPLLVEDVCVHQRGVGGRLFRKHEPHVARRAVGGAVARRGPRTAGPVRPDVAVLVLRLPIAGRTPLVAVQQGFARRFLTSEKGGKNPARGRDGGYVVKSCLRSKNVSPCRRTRGLPLGAPA